MLNSWGDKLLGAVTLAAEMVACGFGLEADAFTRRMQLGPHLLAPTGACVAHGISGVGAGGQELEATPAVCRCLK